MEKTVIRESTAYESLIRGIVGTMIRSTPGTLETRARVHLLDILSFSLSLSVSFSRSIFPPSIPSSSFYFFVLLTPEKSAASPVFFPFQLFFIPCSVFPVACLPLCFSVSLRRSYYLEPLSLALSISFSSSSSRSVRPVTGFSLSLSRKAVSWRRTVALDRLWLVQVLSPSLYLSFSLFSFSFLYFLCPFSTFHKNRLLFETTISDLSFYHFH